MTIDQHSTKKPLALSHRVTIEGAFLALLRAVHGICHLRLVVMEGGESK